MCYLYSHCSSKVKKLNRIAWPVAIESWFFHDNSLTGSIDPRETRALFVNIDPKDSLQTVFRQDAFKFSFLSMSVSSADTFGLDVKSCFGKV